MPPRRVPRKRPDNTLATTESNDDIKVAEPVATIIESPKHALVINAADFSDVSEDKKQITQREDILDEMFNILPSPKGGVPSPKGGVTDLRTKTVTSIVRTANCWRIKYSDSSTEERPLDHSPPSVY